MDHTTVRIILERVISSPANVDLPEFDEAIRWVEDRGTIRQPARGTDRHVHSSHFEAAAVEMRVLRRLLARGWFAGATESAQRVLSLLSREISLRGTSPAPPSVMGTGTGANRKERGPNELPRTTIRMKVELFFRYVISVLGLLSFAALLALVARWFITTPTPPP